MFGLSKGQRLRRLEQQLKRMELSAPFFRADQVCAFLRYIVSETAAGREKQLKQYSIAVDALGAPPDFDPDSDALVRVHAQRLRKKLEDYYAGPGAKDRVRITLSKGSYAPEIKFNSSRRWLWVVAAGILVLLGFVGWRTRREEPAPKISGPVQITFEQGEASDPALSPDAKWLAYSSDRSGIRQIWLQDRSTGEARQVSFGPRQHVTPEFSPDSGHILYRSLGRDGGLEKIPRSGGSAVRLVDGFAPRYSPDGRLILFTRVTQGKPSLHLMPAQGGAEQAVAPHVAMIQCGVWMPDGRLLVRAHHSGIWDWWILPPTHEGDLSRWPLERTHASDRIKEAGLSPVFGGLSR